MLQLQCCFDFSVIDIIYLQDCNKNIGIRTFHVSSFLAIFIVNFTLIFTFAILNEILKIIVLICSGGHKNMPQSGWFEMWTFISHSSGEIRYGLRYGPLGFWGEPSSWLAAWLPSCYVLTWDRERQRTNPLVSLLIRDQPHYEGPTLTPPPNCHCLLTAPSLNTIPFGHQDFNM